MTVKSLSSGHEIYFDGEQWRFSDTKEIVNHERVCSHCGEEPAVFEVDGKSFFVDRCLFNLVKALNDGGVPTKMACCGHGKMPGVIILSDDKYIGVFENRKHWDERLKIPTVTIYGESLGGKSWQK